MAIQLVKTLDSGVVTQYHRIMRINLDYRFQTAQVEIGSYLTEQSRREGLNPAMVHVFQLEGPGLVEQGDLRALVYAALSSDGQPFVGGEQA